ncbi:MAG: hypothetical protein JW874_08570 [Spirochaetales bacterium]|nr:hypothetical protein [Spirochaetales bacterium]
MYPAAYGDDPLFPKSKDFKIVNVNENCGLGVICFRNFKKNEIIARLAGEIIHDIRQHSLQITPGTHLYDIYFSGYFLHSCEPNVYLDMENLLVYAVRDIRRNDLLMMDYAQTEDYLYKQFACSCGSMNCRKWICGRLEIPEALVEPHLATPQILKMN